MAGAVLLHPPRTHSRHISLQLQRLVGICGDGGNRTRGSYSRRKMGAPICVRHYSATTINGICGPSRPASGQTAEVRRASG